MFLSSILGEEYIEGGEINKGLLGNDPVEALPPVELEFGKGERIFTYEDKIHASSRTVEKICPAPLSPEETAHLQELSIKVFKELDCFNSARVDFRYKIS